MGPRVVTGVFAGYSLKDGRRRGGHSLVWDLRNFARADLRADSRYGALASLTTPRVKHMELPEGGIMFPLREADVAANENLVGAKGPGEGRSGTRTFVRSSTSRPRRRRRGAGCAADDDGRISTSCSEAVASTPRTPQTVLRFRFSAVAASRVLRRRRVK
eukprot:4119176-Alexandrium_andersonii.AAC.1